MKAKIYDSIDQAWAGEWTRYNLIGVRMGNKIKIIKNRYGDLGKMLTDEEFFLYAL